MCAEITRQYVEYIELMQEMQLELAGEYLVMSAMLAEIKSRILLPRPAGADEDEEDSRAELIRRLQEYERYKQAAEDLDALPRLGRDVFQASAEGPEQKVVRLPPEVDLQDLIGAFQEVMKRAAMYAHHHVQLESLSVRERMSSVLSKGVFTVDETLQHVEATLTHRRKLGAETQRTVRKGLAFIHEHYGENISRADVAAHIGVQGVRIAAVEHAIVVVVRVTVVAQPVRIGIDAIVEGIAVAQRAKPVRSDRAVVTRVGVDVAAHIGV